MFVLLVAVAFAIIYIYVKHSYSYWQRRGVPYLPPLFPFGNFGKMFVQNLPLGELLAEFYRSTSEPFVGIFVLQKPILLIRDPNLIRSILVTDFHYFTDRTFYLNEKDEPLTAHVSALRGHRWRDRRTKLTPIFTPNKIRTIFPVIRECGHQLQKYLTQVAVNANQSIEMGEVIGCYAMNVIATTALGIDVDCFAHPNHPFRNNVHQIFEINWANTYRFFGWFLNPTLLKWSGLRFLDRGFETYFLNLVAQVIEMRKRNNIARKDLFQLLVNLQNRNAIDSLNGDDETATEKNERKPLLFENVAAEVFTFIFAGIETTSLTASYFLYEIAKHPDAQQKLHTEIDRVVDERNGELTYDAINEMKYLDCCLNEILRKYPPIHLGREAVSNYKITGTNIVIEKGTSIIIPTFALHNDEKFFPDPKKFEPTRFWSENKTGKSTIDMPYLPFGDGPRTCIGQRMGKMFVKVGICSILQQFYVSLDDRHIGKDIKLSVNIHPVGGIHLKLKAKQYPHVALD